MTNDDVEEPKVEEESKTLGITQDQYEKMINMIQATSVAQGASSSSKPVNMVKYAFPSSSDFDPGIISLICSLFSNCLGLWIIDSGASIHVCSSLKYFKSYVPLKPVSIRLRNGHKVYAKIKGIVHFSSKLYITDVLYVPEFNLNLISVPKLMVDLNVKVIFDVPKCQIQDVRTKEMIGSDMMFEGLVYLEIPREDVHTASTIETQTEALPEKALWHFRLGNLSNIRMKLSIIDNSYL